MSRKLGFGTATVGAIALMIGCSGAVDVSDAKDPQTSGNGHVEDVHRAGGVMALLGELDRAGLLHRDVSTVYADTMGEALDRWDVLRNDSTALHTMYAAGPAGIRTQEPFSQSTRWKSLDLDRASGCIRDLEHAYSREGGLAVLYGNLAPNGCVVKTSGVDESILTFEGPAHVCESQEDAVAAILSDRVKPGEVVVVRYEGPRGGPGMQEMLYPTSYLKSKGLGKVCALITDGRFSGGSSGLSIGHVSPEAAGGGTIALVEHGDLIRIDIPNRTIALLVDDDKLATRRVGCTFRPSTPRPRKVSPALRAYAHFVSSADRGAIRDLP